MKITFLNNQGSGFADELEVRDGITVAELFAEQMHGEASEAYLIRVNRLPATREQVLQPGDRVSITPTKIAGARAA